VSAHPGTNYQKYLFFIFVDVVTKISYGKCSRALTFENLCRHRSRENTFYLVVCSRALTFENLFRHRSRENTFYLVVCSRALTFENLFRHRSRENTF
jgi:hypothetical protein